MATGIALVVLFGTFPIQTSPRYRESASLPDLADYPYLQFYTSWLEQSYAVGERIDFQIMQIAGGCAYPESIVVKYWLSGLAIYEFNGTKASSLLFCPVQINQSGLTCSGSLTNGQIGRLPSEPGDYALVIKHL
jgi:hypothetical protein